MTAAVWSRRPTRAATLRRSLPTPALPDGSGWAIGIACLAAILVAGGVMLGWRGGDLPAQLYRTEAVRRHGLALWDSQWFGGHWTLGYSVAYPALASIVGLGALSVVSAAVAAMGFDRLVAGQFARGSARAASVVFAVSIVVETAIGQLPFLAGEAAGLWACVALVRRRPLAAVVATVISGLLSPLAAAFVAMAVGAWLLATWLPEIPARVPALLGGRLAGVGGSGRMAGAQAGGVGLTARVVAAGPSSSRWRRPGGVAAIGVLAAVAVPLGVVGLLFPGQGPMPYPLGDYAWEIGLALALWAITPRAELVLRSGIIVFAITATASVAVPSALGGNVGRIEDLAALPLAAALLWSRRRVLLAVLAVPLVLSQWGPAWSPMVANAGHRWTHESYYRPLATWLHRSAGPYARVEVVPTADHWEAAFVAPTVALARGWERQLDVADNPIFYQRGQLDAAAYRTWLVDNGVRYVALPSAPLDYAGVAEGRLVVSGVPGLRLVMRSGHWRVYQVVGGAGIVSGPGYLSSLDGSRVALVATRPGTIEVRLRDNSSWQVRSGAATIEPTPSPGGWILLQATSAGVVHLDLGPPVL